MDKCPQCFPASPEETGIGWGTMKMHLDYPITRIQRFRTWCWKKIWWNPLMVHLYTYLERHNPDE